MSSIETSEILDEPGQVLRTLRSGVAREIISEVQGIELYHAYLALVEEELTSSHVPASTPRPLPNYHIDSPHSY